MLYDIGFFIFSIFYLPVLIFKGKLHKDFAERFGIYSESKSQALWAARDSIWIQAVSVGEVTLCKSLVPELKKAFPLRPIVFSTITRTGNDLAKKLFHNDAAIIYFPLDFSFITRKVIKLIRPKLYIMIETEIWPNVLKELSGEGVPSILINGRISDRSFWKYKLARPFLQKTLERIDLFCMQSDTDAERIKVLGSPAVKVMVTGNMKFDAEAGSAVKPIEVIKSSLGLSGQDEEFFVAGSTHGGEEEAVVSAYKELLRDFPRLKLLIAPRHVERSGEVENVVRRLGLESVRVSSVNGSPGRSRLIKNRERDRQVTPACRQQEPGQAGHRPSVYILDTIGHLNDAYALATLVFIGGSLVPHGGQNPLEPAAFEKPVVFGPYMFNFKAIVTALLKNKGALQVADAKELLDKAALLLKDKEAAALLGKNAKKTILENRGATARNLDIIKEIAAQGAYLKYA